MRLKRIDLEGFKSFCDPVTISFEHNIVGVVGPNGCGKSNVLDAIRWVMGERSIKNLRGKERLDVIFAGSEKRNPAPQARVTLTLADVEPDYRPEGLQDQSEIAITRVLKRSGSSEYLANGEPCRLRDIRMLFLGTGLGNKNSYALLEQGRVSAFIQSTPENRRLWIEEAAGITRYKEHRKQAESNLNSTQGNLDRLNDILRELGQQRKSLQRQASKARRHRLLREEIEHLDLYLAAHRYLENWAKERQLKMLLDDLGAVEQTLREAIQEQEQALEKTEEKLKEEAGQIQEERDKLQKSQARVALLQQSAEHMQSDAGGLKTRQDQLAEEQQKLTDQQKQSEHQEQVITEQIEQLQQEGGDAHESLEQLNADLEELNERLTEADALIENIKGDVIEAVTKETTARNHVQELGRRTQELQQRQERQRAELDEATAQEAMARAQQHKNIEEVERNREEQEILVHAQEDVSARKEVLKEQVEQSRVRLQQSRQHLAERRAKLESLEEIQAQYQDLNEASRALLLSRDTDGPLDNAQLLGLVADLIDVPQAYEGPIAAALGDRLQYLVIDRPEDARVAIEYLEQQQLGRTGFVANPQSSATFEETLPRDPSIRGSLLQLLASASPSPLLAQLLRPFVLVGDIDDALRLRPQVSSHLTLVTEKGELLHPDGAILGGSQRSAGLGMIQRKRQIRELTEEVNELDEQTLRLEDTLADQEYEYEQLTLQLAQYRDQLQQIALRQTKLLADQERLEQEVARHKERVHRLQLEARQLQQEQTGLQEAQAEAHKSLEVYEKLRQDHEARLQEARMQIEADRQRQAILSRQCTDLKVRIAAQRERLEALQQQHKNLLHRQDYLKRRSIEIDAEHEVLNEKLSEKLQGHEEIKSEIETLRQAIQTDEARIQAQNQGYLSLEASHLKARKEIEMRRIELEQNREKRTQHLLALREVDVNLKALNDDIRQRYGISIGETLPGHHCSPRPSKQDPQKLKDLQKELARLGDVNPLAEKEYDEVDERYTFLKEQVADLEKASSAIKGTIRKLDQQIREEFQTTFEAIRGHFATLFPKIFEGGSAELILTDPRNLLETGVEIMVRPPGKRRQTVALLSGGEKAMTTIALLFAFFLYKPSPFCVLDEVDAPLDDVNIDRYNNVLRELSQLTQFIVITHNKRTMEMTDHLYGVTMQEPGVSTVVAVRLEARSQAQPIQHAYVS
ncbi:MAG: chromosome segregation protein SMC [Myxococcales bacterium]|nr:chromosome segregation protein SMC [Myxococcales bacterium]MCB9642879.1 chromosome segregation protein SMC [Myxococcales bacterium]